MRRRIFLRRWPTSMSSDPRIARVPAASVSLESVGYSYPGDPSRRRLAIREVSFEAAAGEFVSIVGPSGCGKSTILSLVSGLAEPSAGSVKVLGKPVSGVSKDVGFIFQRDALLPWRVARENVAVPLRYRGVGRREARERSAEWLARVGLSGYEDHYPHQLSGGMRKRVAIAATLVCEPAVLLMDEPFSALDPHTRNLMEADLLQLWEQSGGRTVLFVTHDLEEAVGLSDRVVVLSASPATVVGEYRVPIERPRDLLDGRFAPEFVELYQAIWDDLRGQVTAAYARQMTDADR
jgi:sulfonate transport system ATP-binding protein